MTAPPRRLRSFLFAPASRPDVLMKLPRSGPDGVVMDLEDAVAPAAKPDARHHAREATQALRLDHPDLAIFVRVNPVGSEWFDEDLDGALSPGTTGVVVPKIESPADVARVAERLVELDLEELTICAGIETVAGVMAAREVLASPVTVAYFGAEDYCADIGGVRTAEGTEVLWARSLVAAAARLGGVHLLDQVVTELDDEELFTADARMGRAIGYGGKLCIHPRQVEWANTVFTPSPDEVDQATRLVAAYEAAIAEGQAAASFEGAMIDEPLARRARALLDLAE